MSKDFQQTVRAPKHGRTRNPAPRKTKWEREIERIGTRVCAARTILRFQGIENYLTPEQIAAIKAVANMQHDQKLGSK
jgi:hypothetical protein